MLVVPGYRHHCRGKNRLGWVLKYEDRILNFHDRIRSGRGRCGAVAASLASGGLPPGMAGSMLSATKLLGLSGLDVIHVGDGTYPMAHGVRAVGGRDGRDLGALESGLRAVMEIDSG